MKKQKQVVYISIQTQGLRVAQCLRVLYCSANCAIRDSGFTPRLCRNRRDREVRGATHNWPSVVRVSEGLAGRVVLVSSRTSDSCGGPGAGRANQGCQVHGVSSDTLVRLASALDARCVRCVKKQCGLVGLCIGGRMTFNLRLSRARTGVVATR